METVHISRGIWIFSGQWQYFCFIESIAMFSYVLLLSNKAFCSTQHNVQLLMGPLRFCSKCKILMPKNNMACRLLDEGSLQMKLAFLDIGSGFFC